MPIKKEKMISICILGISVLFYLFWAFYDGVILCPDSASYINMSISREPFYCMFLACLKMLFNYNAYLTVAVYLQSILAALAAYCMADYLRKEFKLTCFQMSLVVSIPLLVSLLCRFVAKQASMYSNCILTEGIACSLFLIFARYLLEFCYRKKWKSLFISSVISFILVSTRKQMCITVFLIICTIFVVYCKNKEIKRGVLISFLCASCIICGSLLLDRGYNYIVHGEAVTHSSDNRFLATMVVYTSERVDGERIQEETARSLFYQIYDTCEEKGYLQKDILGGAQYQSISFYGIL